MSAEFTGAESAVDILKAVLEDCSQNRDPNLGEIVYKNGIPYLLGHLDGPLEFSTRHRVDNMLLEIFPDCELICNDFVKQGLIEREMCAVFTRVLAYVAMNGILDRLIVNQTLLFKENLEDARFLGSATLLHSIAKVRHRPGAEKLISTLMTKQIRTNLDKRIGFAAKRKREFLVNMLNTLPLVSLQTSSGRPIGSTKPEKKKEQEKAEFESKVEQTVKALVSALGREPFKYEVAEALGIGGINPKGTDSRINSFNNKLARLGIDYPALITRLNLHG